MKQLEKDPPEQLKSSSIAAANLGMMTNNKQASQKPPPYNLDNYKDYIAPDLTNWAPMDPQKNGSKPTGDGFTKPYIYNISEGLFNQDIGGSLFGYQQDNNYLKVLNGHSKMGSWGEEDGSKTYGTETQGSVLDSQFDLLNGFSKMDPNSTDKQKDFWTLNTSFLNAYGGAKFNKNNGMFLGAGASLFDISTRFGTSGTGNRDSNTKLGYSLGPALGGGLHWSDDDHDGIPEYGFRIDTPLGLSIDTKSEDPVRDYFLNSIMGPGAMALNPEDNLTQDLSNFNAQHILKLVQMSQQASNAIGNFGLSMLGLESK